MADAAKNWEAAIQFRARLYCKKKEMLLKWIQSLRYIDCPVAGLSLEKS